MRAEDLTGQLRQPYSTARGYGLARVGRPGYENIWFVVPPPLPELVPAGLPAGIIGAANEILQRRPRADDASDLDRLMAYLFARREAVSSSRMEGTWSTVDNVLAPQGADGEGPGKSAHQSVRGYAAALEYALGKMQRSGIDALTAELVSELHERVMSRDPVFQGIAGRIRSPGLPGDVVQIGSPGRKEDSIYNPAPPEHVARCLEGVLAWMRNRTLIEMGDAGMGMALPVRMAIGHAHFEAVHPFSDGNGRVGRILWPLQMAAAGQLPLYISGYVERNRDGYRAALEEAQKQLRYSAIVGFVAQAIIASHDEEKVSKAAMGDLQDAWLRRTNFRRDASAARALPVLIGMPILTARTLADRLGVSFQAASTALNALAARRVVRERTGQGRNRVFAAEEVIAILSRPFAEEPEIGLEEARRILGISAA